MKIITTQFFLFFAVSNAFCQLAEYPIGLQGTAAKKNPAGNRIQATLNLPFFDDFSNPDISGSPDKNLWQSGNSVFLNNGIGVDPPSRNAVTFDGVNAEGKPYDVNNVLAKGFADSLISQPIRMASIDPALRTTVYLSFFYQVKGNGESPDPGDQLIVSYRNSSNRWEPVYTIENSATLDPAVFYQVIIPVTEDRFYHDAFQFRFHNFARLSGPYDTWNVDYVYMNVNRDVNDLSFTDRTISSPLTSLLVDYYSIPFRHFIQDPAGNLKKPAVRLYNLKVGPPQPFSYTSSAVITSKINGQVTSSTLPLDTEQDPNTVLNSQAFLNLTLNKIPDTNAFSPAADSIGVGFKFNISTKDNVPPGPQNGDYDAAKYSPIDFRVNDTIRYNYILSSYYAYDDGTAEYGAGLNQAGSYVAIKYLMKSVTPDTLIGVNIYFPEFGDNTSQSIQLEVRSDLSDKAGSVLSQQTIQVNRSSQNIFKSFPVKPAVLIKGDFYVGWKQLTNASIPVGLDKNTDNGNKIYSNTNGAWIPNTIVVGSMMVRPVFGRGTPDMVTGLETTRHTPIYPNPTSRICYLPAESEVIFTMDITGRKIETDIQDLTDRKALTFLTPVSGMAIIRYSLNGKLFTEKVMVRGE